MTTAKSMSSKLAVGFVAVAMLFAFSVPAQAQTSVEAQIQALLAQIAALQSQLGGGMSGAGVCPYTWTRDLNVGASGADVQKLQQFLNSDPETRIAVSGAGSAGQETMTYGPLTGAAVAKFQTKYRADILTPLGLVNATTYFGASSRAKANALCSTATPGTPTTPTGPLTGGEGVLENEDQLGDVESTLDEGDTENVLGVSFDAEDSDIRLERVDVEIEIADAGGSIRLDQYLDEVELMLDGTRIGRLSAGDTSRDGRVHTLRFTGLNGVVRDGETGELYVRVTAVDGIDSDEAGDNLTVTIPEYGIRAVDAMGISETYFGTEFEEIFTVEEAATADLQINEGDDNPDSRVEEVDEDDTTEGIELLEFTLEPGNGDVMVDELPVILTSTGGPDVDGVLQSISLKRGSTTLQTKSIPSSATTTSTITFTNLNLDLSEDDEETFMIVATVRALGGSFGNGDTITAEIDENDWIVEDEDGESVDADGSAQGETVTFRADGISVTFVSASESKSTNSATTTETGTYTIKFDVTAFGENAFISATSTASAVVDYDIVGGGSGNAVLTSTASRVGDAFRVNDGQTRQFTLTVAVTGNGAFNSVNLDAVGFGTSSTVTTGSSVPVDDAVFTTDPLFLGN